jgi:hypothetical protein
MRRFGTELVTQHRGFDHRLGQRFRDLDSSGSSTRVDTPMGRDPAQAVLGHRISGERNVQRRDSRSCAGADEPFRPCVPPEGCAQAELPQGLTASDVESAITTDPTLALLADLANLDKHFVLTHPPRSGDVPRVGVLRSTTLSRGGWQLEMPIEHKGRTMNAVELAPKVVESWLRHLEEWGLIS